MNRKQRRAANKQGASGSQMGSGSGATTAAQALLAEALQHHRAGRRAEAEHIYRQILRSYPNQPDALHLLGVLQDQAGDYSTAIELIQKAVSLKPIYPEAYNNLGNAFDHLGQLDHAAGAYSKAIAIKPDYAEAHNNLGLILKAQDKVDEAIASHRKAVSLNPKNPRALNNLGTALKLVGKLEDAVASYRKAIALKPDYAQAYTNLGNALRGQGNLEEAVAAHRKALELWPDHAEMHINFGNALLEQGKFDEAEGAYRRAVGLKPESPEAHNSLCGALGFQGKFEEAEIAAREAIGLKPDYADAYNRLGGTLKEQGRLREAFDACHKAIELEPGYERAHASLIFYMNHDPSFSASELWEESRRWGELHARPTNAHQGAYVNDRDPGRRLRIGYVSPDFRRHSVNNFFEPVLAAHSGDEVEVFCYAEVIKPDTMTERLQSLAGHWRSTVGQDAARVAAQVESDRIDILVDLAGHTARNRLDVFALRPAPVQVTWLGYPNTTGMDAIQYRLTDAIADPPGESDKLNSEELIRLPNGFHCYAPQSEAPQATALPAVEAGHVTFGSFNNFAKVTDNVVEAWSRILQGVPNSRLLIKSKPLAEQRTRDRCLERFAHHGIEAERLDLIPWTETIDEHLGLYGKVDLALDTFPYGGTTTTCEATWMGVPVVTLRADRHAGRVGASLLTRIGLEELIADSEDAYVVTAIALAADLERLAEMRAGMRARMETSPLCDAKGFARDLEAAYRDLWRRWCEEGAVAEAAESR